MNLVFLITNHICVYVFDENVLMVVFGTSIIDSHHHRDPIFYETVRVKKSLKVRRDRKEGLYLEKGPSTRD